MSVVPRSRHRTTYQELWITAKSIMIILWKNTEDQDSRREHALHYSYRLVVQCTKLRHRRLSGALRSRPIHTLSFLWGAPVTGCSPTSLGFGSLANQPREGCCCHYFVFCLCFVFKGAQWRVDTNWLKGPSPYSSPSGTVEHITKFGDRIEPNFRLVKKSDRMFRGQLSDTVRQTGWHPLA